MKDLAAHSELVQANIKSCREMAVGNTFGATALSSYGGFWISFAIILTPGGFAIQSSIIAADGVEGFYSSFGLYLFVRITAWSPSLTRD